MSLLEGKRGNMKRENYIRKLVSLILVLALSISQISVVSYAEENNSEEFSASEQESLSEKIQ